MGMNLCLGCMEMKEDRHKFCPKCGYAEGTPAVEALHLNPGAELRDRYIVGGVMGFGGFGVTYIGWDKQAEKKVAIKEYLPSEFATRVPGQTKVTVFTDEKKQKQFHDGLVKFLEEAEKIRQFQGEEGIVKIFDSFNFNNTAYIAMELLEGETLAQRLQREGAIPADEAIGLMLPIVKSLQAVHQAGIIHRDISPDNIFLTRDGGAKLIDFAASRYATTSHSRSLTVIIKTGFSPEEQYRSRGDQGSHTDVYSIGAVLYAMITGIAPPDALDRRVAFERDRRDVLKPIRAYIKGMPQNRENAILNALNVRIEDRTPDVVSLAEELTSPGPVARRGNQIKKIDLLKLPLWAKAAALFGIAAVGTLTTLLATGVIGFKSNLSVDISIPDGMARVPSVINSSMDEATDRLTEAELLFSIAGKEHSNMIPADFILLQDIEAGSVVDVNTIIALTISGGPDMRIVPDIRGAEIDEATQTLEDAGFFVRTVYSYSPVIAEGGIISQSEEAGSEFALEGTIILYISKGHDPDDPGPHMAEVPRVVNLSYDEAVEQSQAAGFAVRVSLREYHATIPEGMVISQSLTSGTRVMTDQILSLTVSMGIRRSRMPDLQYKQLDRAIELLEYEGLTANITYQESETVTKGLVISQDPANASTLDFGSAVRLVVSSGGPPIIVPDVTNNNVDTARTTLTSKGFTVAVTYQTSDGAENMVISQTPTAGTPAARGDRVTITVSVKGVDDTVRVPDVTRMTRAQAEAEITGAGLKISVNEIYSNDVPQGQVISQAPQAGSMQMKGSTVIITLSKGPEPVIVPDLSIDSQSIAEARLRTLGLVPSVTAQYSDRVVIGNIISQMPSPGTPAKRGDTVYLVVSLGYDGGEMPDVRKLTQSGAENILRQKNLNLSIVIVQVESNETVGTVTAQVPSPGATIKRDDTVTLSVSKGTDIKVPNVVGKTELEASTAIQTLHLVVSVVRREDATVAAGKVIQQQPVGGASAKVGDTVTILVSTGKPIDTTAPMPNVIGSTEAAARSTLSNSGFTSVTIRTQTTTNQSDDGKVISQSPAPGGSYATNTAVILTIGVYTEDPPVQIPNVTGATEADARSTLGASGFTKLSVGHQPTNNESEGGKVIAQTPNVGSHLTSITVYLTIGDYTEPGTPTETPIPESTIPSVLGQSRFDAENTLRSAGFSNIQINPSTQSTNNQSQDGTVYYQNPSSGTQSPTTTTVMLTLYKYIEPEETPTDTPTETPIPESTIPSVLGQSRSDAENTLRSAGFSNIQINPSTQSTNNQYQDGTVYYQTPSSGTQSPTTTTVTLTLYKYIEPEETPEETETPIPAQTAQIPNVSGKSYGDAVKDLKAKGFTTFKQEPKDTNNNADVGKVISTSPTAGNQYDITKPVTIYVGSTPLEPTSSDDATD